MKASTDRRRQRGERSRESILRAALAVLGEAGGGGFTARRVARRAGVSPGTLFHHFGSLDELLLEAVIGMLDEAVVDRMEGPWPDARHFLLDLGAQSLRLIRERPEAVHIANALFGTVPFHEAVRSKAAEHYARYVAWLEAELARLAPGALPRERLHNVTLAVLMLLDGMGIHWSIHRDPDELERYWVDMADFLARGLEGAPPGP